MEGHVVCIYRYNMYTRELYNLCLPSVPSYRLFASQQRQSGYTLHHEISLRERERERLPAPSSCATHPLFPSPLLRLYRAPRGRALIYLKDGSRRWRVALGNSRSILGRISIFVLIFSATDPFFLLFFFHVYIRCRFVPIFIFRVIVSAIPYMC